MEIQIVLERFTDNNHVMQPSTASVGGRHTYFQDQKLPFASSVAASYK